MKIKNLEMLLEDFQYFAGYWHLDSCRFPVADAAVCNCNHTQIRKKVKEILESFALS